jgi:hypothetical protein
MTILLVLQSAISKENKITIFLKKKTKWLFNKGLKIMPNMRFIISRPRKAQMRSNDRRT